MTAAERKNMVRKIQALQQRTVANGCTEAEAIAAAGKVAALLAQYGLSMTDVEIKDRTGQSEKAEIHTDRRRSHEIEFTVGSIAALYDCMIWRQREFSDSPITYVFFGLPEDAAACRWLYGVIEGAMTAELARYKASTGRKDRRAAHSFLLGMAQRVAERLRKIKTEQQAKTADVTGRDLVVVKSAVVKSDFDSLGLDLDRTRRKSASVNDPAAYRHGVAAGARVNLNRSISAK